MDEEKPAQKKFARRSDGTLITTGPNPHEGVIMEEPDDAWSSLPFLEYPREKVKAKKPEHTTNEYLPTKKISQDQTKLPKNRGARMRSAPADRNLPEIDHQYLTRDLAWVMEAIFPFAQLTKPRLRITYRTRGRKTWLEQLRLFFTTDARQPSHVRLYNGEGLISDDALRNWLEIRQSLDWKLGLEIENATAMLVGSLRIGWSSLLIARNAAPAGLGFMRYAEAHGTRHAFLEAKSGLMDRHPNVAEFLSGYRAAELTIEQKSKLMDEALERILKERQEALERINQEFESQLTPEELKEAKRRQTQRSIVVNWGPDDDFSVIEDVPTGD